MTSLREPTTLVIRSAQIALPTGIAGPHEVICDRGLISAIKPISSDFEDVLLVPGFIDIQVNGIGAIDVSEAHGDDWLALDRDLLRQGVTTWCPTLVSARLESYANKFSRISDAQHRLARGRPAIAGIHLEGPFLGDAIGAHDPLFIQLINSEWLRNLPDNVRIVTVAPENAAASSAISAMRKRKIVVSIGHSKALDSDTVKAIDAGVQLVTHLFNGMSGVHHRHDGVALVALTDDRVVVSIIADLIHVQPRAIALAFRAKPDRIVLVTDSVAFRSESARIRGIELIDGAPRLPDGTLAGSALTMNQAVMNIVQHCSVDLHDAIRAATAIPARILGLADRGEISVGRRADLVALDPNFAVRYAWVGGELSLVEH
ncbi:MAG: amidohydrolase family protein [Ilumatobacteraceae bacterium]